MMPLLAAVLAMQQGYPDYDRLTDAQALALDCEQVTLGADRPYAECLSAQSRVWAKRVDAGYAAAMTRVDPEMRRHVAAAQSAWRAFAAATCSQWDDVQGTLSVRLSASCYLAQYKRRVADLAQVDGLSD